MQSRFQGDPKITITGDGIDIIFSGGQPEMHKGLENAVLISLFTRPGWIGAKFISCEGLTGSNFLSACDQSITVATINQIRQAASKALDWIAGQVEIEVKNPMGNRLDIKITIKAPGETAEETTAFLLSREGLQWYYQILGG